MLMQITFRSRGASFFSLLSPLSHTLTFPLVLARSHAAQPEVGKIHLLCFKKSLCKPQDPQALLSHRQTSCSKALAAPFPSDFNSLSKSPPLLSVPDSAPSPAGLVETYSVAGSGVGTCGQQLCTDCLQQGQGKGITRSIRWIRGMAGVEGLCNNPHLSCRAMG